MRNIFLIISIFILAATVHANDNNKISRQEYIEKFADLAIKEMERTGVPASITLAQGCLESDNGNSKLARKARNHFGIKCHSTWKGKTMRKDDDRKNECFRVYKSDYDSYIDHSDFLRNGKRYAFLFDLKTTDYKGWAKGLKKAGYATNPKYPALLIKIIEDNDLHKYDTPQKLAKADKKEEKQNTSHTSQKSETARKTSTSSNTYGDIVLEEPPVLIDPKEYAIESPIRKVHENNKLTYIVVKKGDTFWGISREFDLMEWQLFKFNDFPKNHILQAGEVLYIQTKKNNASKKYSLHKVAAGETLHSISQLYGMKQRRLARYNSKRKNEDLTVGELLFLRRVNR